MMKDRRKISLLAEGRLVNLAAGDGHPIEIMDLSFGLQLRSVLYLADNRLSPGVYQVPEDIDRAIVTMALEAQGARLDKPTEEQKNYMREWKE